MTCSDDEPDLVIKDSQGNQTTTPLVHHTIEVLSNLVGLIVQSRRSEVPQAETKPGRPPAQSSGPKQQ
jgi:hypothetical protein